MFDQAFFLLLVTAGLNIAVDAIARRYRPRDTYAHAEHRLPGDAAC